MKWFWQRESKLEQQINGMLEELDRLEARVNRLKAENARLKQLVGITYPSEPAAVAAERFKEQLAVVTEATPWWRDLNALLALEIEQAVNDALVPDLSNDTVNLRRGRAAMLKDFRGLLHGLWLQAQRRNKEQK